MEGWHNAFSNRVAISHPTITKLDEQISRLVRDYDQSQIGEYLKNVI